MLSRPMLVIALQFYTGDWYRAMKLVKLLADLEERRREDVSLVLVRTTECPGGKVVGEVARRCSEVFDVEELVIRPDTPARRARWGDSTGGRWGATSCGRGPLSISWPWILAGPRCSSSTGVTGSRSTGTGWTSWWRTTGGDSDAGLQVTGDVFRDGIGRWHVNGNLVLERSFLATHPEVLVMPEPREAWDTYYAAAYLPVSRCSSVVRCDWKRVGLRREFFPEVARKSAWWHGYKDGHLVDLARKFIFSEPTARFPSVVDRGSALDIMRNK